MEIDSDDLKELQGEVYKKLAFAFKVIDVTVRVEKPRLKQPGWYRLVQRDRRDMDYSDEVKMPPPSYTGEDITRADRILDIYDGLKIRVEDKKVLSHYVTRLRQYGSIHGYCEKNGITRKTYYKRRDRASMILIKSEEWQKI